MADDPIWYERINECEARVDLSDLGWGSFHIVDAPLSQLEAAQRTLKRSGDVFDVKAIAAFLRAYGGPDCEGKDWPERFSPKWADFCANMPSRVADRITSGIFHFRKDAAAAEAEEGN